MENKKKRIPMQVSPNFERRIKEIQKEIMKQQGNKISLRDLTEKMTKVDAFNFLEKEMLRVLESVDLKINFDRRKK